MSPTIILFLILGIILFLDVIPRYGMLASNIVIFMFYLFSIPNLDNLTLALFYSIMCLANILFSLFSFALEDKQKISSYSGWPLSFIFLFAGIGIYIVMVIMQSNTPYAILGTPKLLAIAGLSAALGPAQIAVLGFSENRFFFTILNFLRKISAPAAKLLMPIFAAIPFIGPVLLSLIVLISLLLPFFIIPIVFSLYHLAAFNLAIGSLIWAAMVFGFWVFTNYGLKLGEQPSSIAHYLWNGLGTIAQQTAKII